jgi:hypothetical protein
MTPGASLYFTDFEGAYRERRPSVFDYPFAKLQSLAPGFALAVAETRHVPSFDLCRYRPSVA